MEENGKKYNLEYLERQLYNISKLVEINSIINSTLDIVKLLTIIMEIIKDIMETEASTLLLYEESTKDLVFKVALGEAGKELEERYRVRLGQGIAGWVAENRKPIIINDVYSDRRFDPNFDKKTGFTTKSMLCSPLMFKGKLLGVIQAINPVKKLRFDEGDLNLFRAFSDQAALAVQNAIFFQNALEEERITNELTSARAIQEELLPAISNDYNNIQVAAKYQSAREVGAEFYDINHQDNKVKIALGDLHSRGIPGALQASMISGAVKTLSRIRGDNSLQLMKTLNKILQERVGTVSQMTLFYGVIDVVDESFQFVNAGFAYPVLVRNGVARYIKLGVKSLGTREVRAKRVNLKLKKGDLFVVITDGIINIKNKNSQRLGLKRVMDFLQKDFENAEHAVDSLFRMADDFTGGLEKREDMSIIAFRLV